MNDTMESKILHFEQNREEIRKSGFLTDLRLAAACACLYCPGDHETTREEIKAARELLKSKVGMFSNFRGYTEIAVACMLSAEKDSETLLDKSLEAYACLKKKFLFAEYLPMAAIMTAKKVSSEAYSDVAERTYSIFKLIRKDHPLLTGQEDELMCVLLALQDSRPKEQAENCEFCYRQLKGHFGMLASGDGIQSLSEVLAAAGGNMEENCQRAISFYQYFKEHDSAISNGYSLGALGALAILPVPVEELSEKVLEVSDALKEQKDYNGLLGISRGSRMIHAALLVASDYAEGENGVIAAIEGTIAAIIEEEIMIICMISASTAASASAK